MALSNTQIVEGIFKALLFRSPSTTETSYWTNQLTLGLQTPLTLILLAAEQPVLLERNLPLASAFYSAFGRLMTSEEVEFWSGVLNKGASLEQVATSFVSSQEFSDRFSGQSLEQIYASITGQAITAALLAEYTKQLDQPGLILLDIAANQNSDLAIGLGLIDTVIKESVTSYADMVNLGDETIPAVASLVEGFDDLNTHQFNEVNGVLTVSVSAQSSVVIDLQNSSITVDDAAASLDGGSFANILTVDASKQENATVDLFGNSLPENYSASAAGGSIRGRGGDDSITLNNGSDKIIFEVDAATNGVDIISNFTIGSSGDTLNFLSFLNSPSASNIGPQEATSQSAKSWANGDILVVSGFGLDTVEEIADLFVDQDSSTDGHQAVYAAPTGQAKAVVISADITGNANIWYVTNQTDVSSIESSEVGLVGIIEDINNLTLVSFSSDNFAVLG